jgi:dihydroorotate dehydrogenase
MYEKFLKNILFRLDAEKAHRFAFESLKIMSKFSIFNDIAGGVNHLQSESLKRTVFGLTFANPVGLAAGFDKNAELTDYWATLGFGFMEIGTVTPRPQAGNPKPRLFRLPEDFALVNRMGFNNDGAEIIAERLSKRKSKMIIGGNIGKNKTTENELAFEDYRTAFLTLYPHCDFFTVNVSSPNTPNLRALQEKEPLEKLLADLQNCNQKQVKPKPILLKIAPDLTEGQLNDILEIVPKTGTAGIIATNTTIERKNLKTPLHKIDEIGAGGLSGMPLRDKSTDIIRYLHSHSGGQIPIIAVGGIMSPDDALEKIKAGASLIQLYTGMIYKGPSLVREIKERLV